ncbi:Hypothetical protein PHPALM_878 [Phytophthora palmivora]|uniref:C2H2-type domain-containing protein n=1 Tax=Phytophthora palmivora TaxID=4796 RepID=A0A2P4YTU9_9STRA|nr:Hypothetical protein PHPALM_878 [Phytophthora palmivora]
MPRGPRTSEPAPPSAADLAAGIVSPMDIPINSPIPLLRLNTREFRRQKFNKYIRLKSYKELALVGRKPYENSGLRKLQRLRSSLGLPVTTITDNLQDMDEEFHINKNSCASCTCTMCRHLRRWSSTLQPYRCKNVNCGIIFDSFTDMYEHQLDVHGGLDPRANRIVEATFHQQRGKLAFPPATVYAGQQYMVPSCPPTPWKSMEELDEEAKTLQARLGNYNPFNHDTPFKLFLEGYKLVKRYGWKEMQRQYHLAMEHFYSAMKFPASSRGFHDGCPSVERGRNWLTSTDREESRIFHPFSLVDKVDVEPEFVLIDTKRDQAMEDMCIEISDDSDAGLSVNDKNGNDEKGFKTDDDVEMQTPDDNDVGPAKERKVFDTDSENDTELTNVESHECEAFSEHNVMDVESDSDSDMTVMSEVASDTDKVNLEDSDSDSELESDSSQISDTKSSSESESESESESDSDDDNEGESEGKVKGSQGGYIDDTVSATESDSDSDSSDSDSESESDSDTSDSEEDHFTKGAALHEVSSSSEDSSDSEDENPSERPAVHEVSSSSEDSNDSDTESKVSEADSTKFVSDSDSESD